ncbi:MAG: anthranilate phosphoribosyltransferase [Acidiferrobacterales bacterium]|nr:anthranilate phosphoribosyltransferase [Acidiferrobacterales bacterium]
MNIQEALKKITERQDLTGDEMQDVVRQIMTGQITDSMICAFLIGMRMKGESIEEITAAATVMRELVSAVDISAPHLIDVVGTGGDGSSSFNVSTASAFVAAAAGAQVAKHGARAASGKCGSADLLEFAGVRMDLEPAQIAQCIRQTGFGFMLAPAHHTAMRHAIEARRELGVRTIFNILGPMTNPAHVSRELMGVFSVQLVEPLAHVLGKLGSEHVLVVSSEDGLDEISCNAPTRVAEMKGGEVNTYSIHPVQFGVDSHDREEITVASPEESLTLIRSVFSGEKSPAADMVILNSGAAIYVSGLTESLTDGISLAHEVVMSGKVSDRFDEFVKLTNSL